MGLLTFFTAGPKEVRAWTVRSGATAPQAAGAIHTDFERGFIRAETIAYDDYVAFKGEAGAREAGRLRLEGKEYVVQGRRRHAFPLQCKLMALQPNPVPASKLLAESKAPVAAVGKLPQFHAVGFTGHRHLDDPAGAARAIRSALDSLRAEVPGEWIALSSIARGGDQLFVQQARSIGMSWHAILPLSHAEFAADFTPAEWSAAEKMLATADHLKVINQNGDRKDAYLDCGIETVIGSDVLIAFWDGDAARGKGGTADVVAICHVDRQARDNHRCRHARVAEGELEQARAQRCRP